MLEHLHVENVRTSLLAEVNGVQLSAINSIADFEKLGIAHGGLGIVLKRELMKLNETGIEQAIIDQRRVVHAKERAEQRAVSPLWIAFENKNKDIFLSFARESKDPNAPLNVRNVILFVE